MKTSLFFILGLMLAGSAVIGQIKVMPGSVAGGERVLEQKGCLGCHSINGKGGTRGPDFANPTGRTSKPGLLASEMWNHSPAMWSEFEAQKKPVPSLTSNEAASLQAAAKFLPGLLYRYTLLRGFPWGLAITRHQANATWIW